jgi:hypothetical protein
LALSVFDPAGVSFDFGLTQPVWGLRVRSVVGPACQVGPPCPVFQVVLVGPSCQIGGEVDLTC